MHIFYVFQEFTQRIETSEFSSQLRLGKTPISLYPAKAHSRYLDGTPKLKVS